MASVSIDSGVLRSTLAALLTPVVQRHANDVANTATNLSAQRLGTWDRQRNPGGGDVLGRYRNGWKVEQKRQGSTEVRRAVVNAAPWAVFLEEGTRSHRITSRRNGGRLKFGNPAVFRRSVNHPGTRPYRIGADAAMRTPLR